ncbi:hypothetical protein GCM10007416_32260 [Kroppenstedtia guangzhouensis]|uniref:Uncharacterized protein n=1 Tax=Kroppenstedtia guangzhouensis TaxID=1274356 RepID=A0ABQ1H3Z7_9BACL|nr:hypothetical protein [Kroppenstedtia guangzhouensis]GGA56588.1 hypothetical protein GCM10007416_32260 [Kroppenstedtia guangzhouensis]
MSKALDSWAQMTRENDPAYQRQQREKRQRKEQAERISFLTRRVLLPEKMTGRTLAAVLQSLNKQITAAHMNLKVERFVVDDREIKVIFKGDDK